MLELAESGARGVFHCMAAEPVTRFELARRAAETFELDESLLRSGPPIEAELPAGPVPYDTSVDSQATARSIGRTPPTVAELLGRFRKERAQA
jgi:dTDP-4-dehydrorhamnose reductase